MKRSGVQFTWFGYDQLNEMFLFFIPRLFGSEVKLFSYDPLLCIFMSRGHLPSHYTFKELNLWFRKEEVYLLALQYYTWILDHSITSTTLI